MKQNFPSLTSRIGEERDTVRVLYKKNEKKIQKVRTKTSNTVGLYRICGHVLIYNMIMVLYVIIRKRTGGTTTWSPEDKSLNGNGRVPTKFYW